MKDYITKRGCRYGIGATVSLGNFQSIKPVYEESIEFDTALLPEGKTEEQVINEFKEKVRQRFFDVQNTALNDFIAYTTWLQKVDVPSKK